MMSLRSFFRRWTLAALYLFGMWSTNVRAEEPSGLLGTLQEERLVIVGKLRAEVETSLSVARRTMLEDPGRAEQDLKLSLETLDRAPDIEPPLRDQLRRQLQAAIRRARLQKAEADQRLADRQAAAAAAHELERVNQSTVSLQQKLQQLVDRFNALVDEGRLDIAQDQAATEISRVAPNTSLDSSLTFGGQLTRAARENESLWRLRHDHYVRALTGVESAAVAFSDNPPITFMPLEEWQQITDLRAKYKSVDVHRP
ncbi:MAG: hypothetical protein JF612_05900, partial [Planctomycetia bacterium]|nr:hypothetical protein [Planctomycetia bacterium]